MTKTNRTPYALTDTEAELIHDIISDRLASTKNWLVTAVEDEKLDRAKDLTKRIRELQDLYATFNVRVRREIEAYKAA